jgi:uncharacterized protein
MQLQKNKRVFIIHGWDGFPEEGWFPWLKKELESRGFTVTVPQMPKPQEPRINNWVPALTELVGTPDAETYFVGHSMGCQTIARYIESLPDGIKVGGAVFVAGFLKRLTNIGNKEIEQSVVNEWLKTPLDLKKAKDRMKKSVAVFSDNDPFVPLDNQDEFKDVLGSKIVIEHDKGHFSGSTGTKELPVVLDEVLEMAA